MSPTAFELYRLRFRDRTESDIGHGQKTFFTLPPGSCIVLCLLSLLQNGAHTAARFIKAAGDVRLDSTNQPCSDPEPGFYGSMQTSR